MQLLNTIRKKLSQTPKDDILKKMGYHNLEAGRNRLNGLLESNDLYHWLKKGGFDMKYSSEAFLYQLAETVGLSEEMQKHLHRYQKRLDAIAKMSQPYIFIDTHFKRKSEPIFVLAFMEGRRRIFIDKEALVYKRLDEALDYVGSIIKEHYRDSKGSLKMWGKIESYVYHHIDGTIWIFDKDGRIIENTEEVTESRVELTIGGRPISIGLGENRNSY